MLCLNSQTRGRCPLRPPVLPKRPKEFLQEWLGYVLFNSAKLRIFFPGGILRRDSVPLDRQSFGQTSSKQAIPERFGPAPVRAGRHPRRRAARKRPDDHATSQADPHPQAGGGRRGRGDPTAGTPQRRSREQGHGRLRRGHCGFPDLDINQFLKLRV